MVENDTTNSDLTIKQEIPMDIETEDSKQNDEMKIKTEMKTEIVETIDEDLNNQITENDLKNGDKHVLLSNTLKRKRLRGKRRRPHKSIRLINTVLKPEKKQKTDSKSTSKTKKPSESAPPDMEETSNDSKTYDDMQDDVEYILTVSNLPNTWSFMDIKNYIDTECEPVDEMELLKDKKTGNGAIRLLYQSETQAKNTLIKLKDKVIEGQKLSVEMTVEKLETDTEGQSDLDEKPWKPDMDEWDIDPKGLYGLKEEFLKTLNIEPPIDRHVGVSNFRCDKTQLRDIMELAGKVLHISVFTGINKHANVMYTHPLEAVQAVSMLHNQQYYGHALHVNIIRGPPETVILPKGLPSIGKGLGINGKPLRNVKKHYKKLVGKESSLLNPTIFDVPDTPGVKIPEVNFKVQNVEVLAKSFDESIQNNTETTQKQALPAQSQAMPQATPQAKPQATPQAKPQAKPQATPQPTPQPKPQTKPQNSIPFVNRPQVPSVPRPTNPLTMQQNFTRPNAPFPRPNMVRPLGPYNAGPRPMGPYGPDPRMMRPFGNGWNNIGQVPMHGPAPMGGPIRGPMPGPCGPMQSPMQVPIRPIIYNSNDPVQVQLSNLPPSTTFNILCEKMAQCGLVVSLQLTTPGCAVVTFANRVQADNCIKTYNGTFVDGCTIQVKYT